MRGCSRHVTVWRGGTKRPTGMTGMNEIARPFPKPTAHVEPWFDLLGPDMIVSFLLTFGGADLMFAANPKGRSRVEALVGPDRVKALAAVAHRLPRRVPLAKRWLAGVLAWQGHSTAEIARQLHMSDVTVRKWLKEMAG